MKKFILSIWPSVIWTVVIFYLLSMSTKGIDKDGIFDIFGFDKVIHFILFFILAYFATIHLGNRKTSTPPSTFWMLVIIISAYGLGMEYYQKYFTTRNFSLFDALFDTIGAVSGMVWAKKSPYGNRGRNQN